MNRRFEWDAKKAATNLKRHKVGFREGVTVFDDPLSRTVPDFAHSADEERWLTIGRSITGKILVVSHVDCEPRTTRLISVRRATRAERYAYEEE